MLIACLVTPLRADLPPDAAPNAGQLAWVARSLSTGSGTAESRAITTDEAGNSYVVGRFPDTVNFFGTTLTSTSASVPSGFLAKFSRTGAPVFVKKIGSNAWTELLAVVVKTSGEIYVGGSVAGTFASGAVNFVVAGTNGQSALLLRLDANGDFVWNNQIGAGAIFGDQVINLAVAPSGMIGITGFFRSNTILDGIVLEANNVQSVLTAILNPNGTALWARIATGPPATHIGQQVAATPDSDFIFAGYAGAVDFGSGLISIGIASREAFVAYYQGFSNFELGAPTTRTQWRENHFTVDDLADAAFIADTSDPDGDGTNNFIEYAYGQSPKQRDAPPALLVPQPPGDLLFGYKQNALATDLTYQLEWSDTLTPAGWQTTGIVETVLNPTANPRPIEAAVPRGTDKRFVSLKVTKP